jgi:outer membrane protein OmpA-like peptidoglycan-associated protein
MSTSVLTPPRTGKCPNYSRCLLASRNELITVPEGDPFLCPECKLPLLAMDPDGRKPVVIPVAILGGISLLVIMGAAAVYFQVRHFKQAQMTGQLGSSFEQAELAVERGELMPSRHMAPVALAIPPDGVQAQPAILSPQYPFNAQARAEILKRLPLLPAVTQDERDQISRMLEGAGQFGRVLTMSFPAGHVALSPGDVDQLRSLTGSAALQPFLKNAACSFLVVGFSDVNGNMEASLSVATQRTQNVLGTLRDACGVTNPIHGIGMGASALFESPQDLQRDRFVEVWAVLP